MIEVMRAEKVQQLAERLLRGELSLADFVAQLSRSRTAEFGQVTLDLDRRRRCGFPEVVYGEEKSLSAIQKIVETLLAEGLGVLVTRVTSEKGEALATRFAQGRYNPQGRTFSLGLAHPGKVIQGRVAIVTAGTSDSSVAEEAHETLVWMGTEVISLYDVGVAGPQRLVDRLDELIDCDAVVVIAGMEGALPSVVGGYVSCPVIAVPTSVGYGVNLGGVTALLGMLSSCAANVSVVNIDAGFKGAYIAGLIARRSSVAANELRERV